MQATVYVFLSVVLLNNYYTFYSVDALQKSTGDVSSERIRVSVWETFDVDELTGYDEHLREIYGCVLNLLVRRMQSWLKRGDPSSTTVNKTYMGFPDRTVSLINVVLTVLVAKSYQVERVRITNLTAAFFYACDMDHMHDPGDVVDVDRNFRQLLKNLRIEDAQRVVDNYTENKLVSELSSKALHPNVQALLEPRYSVAIPVTKNWVFLEKSENTIVNKLKERYLAEYEKNQALAYETETNADRVIENHVTFMGKIIPELFGFAYNHIELVIKLSSAVNSGCPEDAYYSMSIKFHPNNCIKAFSIFLHRYFHFKRVPLDVELVSAIGSLSKFFENDLMSPSSIAEYSDSDIIQMGQLRNDALEKLIAYFGGGNVEKWKIDSKMIIDYPDREQTADELWGLMDSNIEEAFDFNSFISTKLIGKVI